MTYGRPPFRADHVGSLLRPPEPLRAREQHQKGTLSAESLREIEDRSIRDVAKLPEEIGMQGITDGEYVALSGTQTFCDRSKASASRRAPPSDAGVTRKFRVR